MALKKVTLSGILICFLAYAVFHKSTKTPLQNAIGKWKSETVIGITTLSLKSNYVFECVIFDKNTKTSNQYHGNWDMNGQSINTETNKPPDAILSLETKENKQLINHRIVEINDTKLVLQKTDENTALVFNR